MTKVIVRLEFNHIFSNIENKKDTINYLKNVSRYTLENIIGFLTTNPLPNFDNFFSDEVTQKKISEKVIAHCKANNYTIKPELITTEGSLTIAEIILSNKKELILNNILEEDRDRDEMNLFKAFLVTNEKLPRSEKITLSSTTENIEKYAEMMISMKFSSCDLGVFEDDDVELIKLIYVSSYKFEQLLAFLNSNKDYEYLLKELCQFFKQETIESLKTQVDLLLIQVLLFRVRKSYKFHVENKDTINFLNSLISEEIIVDGDFLNLRNFPIYKIDENTFSIINPFFVLDKFTISIKFFLKESFIRKNNLKPSDRKFFNFYNKLFSEFFLMKNLLNNIFSKKYFIKHNLLESENKKPDYYLRYGKDIFIFEYKDSLIAKDIKTSGNIEKILETLIGKYLINPKNKKRIGIGQIINHIEAIVNYNFLYDNEIEKKKKYNIFPILLLSERTLEIPGINFIFNIWFKNNLSYDNAFFKVKDLVVMDIDSLIFFEEYFTKKDKNFKEILEIHINKMNMDTNGYGKSKNKFEQSRLRKISIKLNPFSSRFKSDMFEKKLFINRFLHLAKEEE